jgi:two-component system phosphate regulon response regulator PhoB
MGLQRQEKHRVLIVEDEADLSNSLAYALRAGGYEAEIADRGEVAVRSAEAFRPELVLLDLMLPDMSGMEVCRHLRRGTPAQQPAIIIVSARAQETDRVLGFQMGADDYVVKPFSIRELLLRVEARLKARQAGLSSVAHSGADEVVDPVLALGALRIDVASHRVFVGEQEVHVSALEMRLLLYLLRSPGGMRTRRELLTEVWGYHPEVSSRTVDTHIKRLRDKLGGASELLQTVRGVGFRLAEPSPRGA